MADKDVGRYPYTIRFNTVDRSWVRLNYPLALQKMALCRLRPIFDLMCSRSYDELNRDAIRKTDEEINLLLSETKADWRTASVDFQNKWRVGEERSRKIKADNKRLTNTVMKAKRAYERMEKVHSAFKEAYNRHGCEHYM